MINSTVAVSRQPGSAITPRRLVAFSISVFAFWLLTSGNWEAPTDLIGALLIILAGSLPMVVWARNPYGLGIPIWPAFCLMTVPAYGAPLIQLHDLTLMYPPELRFYGALTVCSYLIAGSIAWYNTAIKPPKPSKQVLTLPLHRAHILLPGLLIASVVFKVALTSGMLWGLGSLVGPVRAVSSGCFLIAAFLICGRWARGEIGSGQKTAFGICLIVYCLAAMSTIYLHEAIVAVGTAAVAYFLGTNRLPWILILVASLVIGLLQPGKDQMRLDLWSSEGGRAVATPMEYPDLYSRWISYSLEDMGRDALDSEAADSPNVLDRFSVLHMLLLSMDQTQVVPYLKGRTYAHIPWLIIPRVFSKNRVTSLQGTYTLSIYFGLQSFEGTQTTTIGWGLLAEAWANFGVFGVLGLALTLGFCYGYLARLGKYRPINSFTPLLGFFFLALAVNTEVTLDVLVASAYQGVIGLLAISLLLMKKRPLDASLANSQMGMDPAAR